MRPLRKYCDLLWNLVGFKISSRYTHNESLLEPWEISSFRVLLDIPINLTIFQDLWDLFWILGGHELQSAKARLSHCWCTGYSGQWETVSEPCAEELGSWVCVASRLSLHKPLLHENYKKECLIMHISLPVPKTGEDFDACAYSFGIGNASQVCSWVICTNLMHCVTQCNTVLPLRGSFEER